MVDPAFSVRHVCNGHLNEALNLRSGNIYSMEVTLKNMFLNNKDTLEYRPEYTGNMGAK